MEPVALLLFSKPPQCNEAKTRLRVQLGGEFVTDLHRAMVGDLITLILDSSASARFAAWYRELPNLTEHSGEIRHRVQNGADFGARFDDAIAQSYKTSQCGIVVIGSDCPTIDLLLIEEALALVRNGNPTVGPTADGGFYLLGLPARYCEIKLCEIFTATDQPAAIEKLLQTRISYLPMRCDLDTRSDIERIIGADLPILSRSARVIDEYAALLMKGR